MTQITRSLSDTSKRTGMKSFFKNSSKSLRIALVLTVAAMAFGTYAFAAPMYSYDQEQSMGQLTTVTSHVTTDGKGNYTITYSGVGMKNNSSENEMAGIDATFSHGDGITVNSIQATPINGTPSTLQTYTSHSPMTTQEYNDVLAHGLTINGSPIPAVVSTYNGGLKTLAGNAATSPKTIDQIGQTLLPSSINGGGTGFDVYPIVTPGKTIQYAITVHATVTGSAASLMCDKTLGNYQSVYSSANKGFYLHYATGYGDVVQYSSGHSGDICTDPSAATVATVSSPTTPTTPQVTSPPVASTTPPITTPVTTPTVQQPTNSPVAHDGATGVSTLQLDKTPQQAQAQTPAGSQLTVQTPAATSAVTPAQTGNPAQTSLYNENASAQHAATKSSSSAHHSATSPATRNDGVIQLSSDTHSDADGVIHLSKNSHAAIKTASVALPTSLLAHHSAKHNYSLYAMWAFLVAATAMYLFVGVRKHVHQRVQSASGMRVSFHEVAQPRLTKTDSFATVSSSSVRDANLHIIDVYTAADQAQRAQAASIDQVMSEPITATLPNVMSIGASVPAAKRKATMPSINAIAAAGSFATRAIKRPVKIARAYASRPTDASVTRHDLPSRIWNVLVKRDTRQKETVSVSQKTDTTV